MLASEFVFRLHEKGCLESNKKQGGWKQNVGSERQFGCNADKESPSGIGKIIYLVEACRDVIRVRLYIGRKTEGVLDIFKKSATKDEWWESNREAGVEKCISAEGSYEDIEKRVADVLDEFYDKYETNVLRANSNVNSTVRMVATTKARKELPPPRDVKEVNDEYWKEYYNYWDAFVKSWIEARKNGVNPDDAVTNAFLSMSPKNKDQKLDLNELPEPYLGFPHEKVSAVVLNLNPGASNGKLDPTKWFNNPLGLNNPPGKLIKYLLDNNCSYYTFLKQYSSLYSQLLELRGTDNEVCGVNGFWQERRDGRSKLSWLKYIYGNDELSSDEVFAMELCPYHSLSTTGFWDALCRKNEKVMREHICKYVIEPAAVAVSQNKIAFANCFGKDYHLIFKELSKINSVGVSEEKEWEKKVREGYFRKYHLYRYEDCEKNIKARFLVMWCGWADGISPRVKSPFSDVEKEIKNFILSNDFS